MVFDGRSFAELSASRTSARDYRHVRAFPFPRFALTSFVTPSLYDRRGQCDVQFVQSDAIQQLRKKREVLGHCAKLRNVST